MSEALSVRNLGDEARAELACLIDRQMSPLGLAAMHALAPLQGEVVLDIGCGAGETLVQLAGLVGAGGAAVGVDVAPLVLDVARSRTQHLPQVTLLQRDAAQLDLPDYSFDCLYSRFGMMFFANPIAAFSNLRRVLKPRGRLAFVCWRSFEENELDTFPV